ncbi:MAG: hypothetical protein ABW005_11075 [Burkholderiaceae bacterium]
MKELQLPLSLLIAAAGPLLALHYLRRNLLQVIGLLCPAPGSAEFWWRVVNVLALSGSVLLVLSFGYGGEHEVGLSELLRRTLWLVTLAVFLSVALVASRIWNQVQRWLQKETAEVKAPAGERA